MKPHQARWVASLGLLGLAGAAVIACSGSDKAPSSTVSEGGGDGQGTGNTNGATGATSSGGSLNLPLGGSESSSAGDTGSGVGGADCGSTRVAAAPPVVNVLLVVDKSLSMNDKPEGFATDKWTALRSALSTTFDETKTKISFGLDLYPYSGKTGEALSDSCQMPTGQTVVVPVADGSKSTPLILKALDANPPSGGTPTAAALARADAYFTAGAGATLKGEKYVLLATDGGPNCNADLTCDASACTVNLDGKVCGKPGTNCCDPKLDPLGATNCLDEDASVQAVARLAKHGIKTFVVGIPGTEAYAGTLDALASTSGVINPDAPPKYFAVSAKAGAAGLSSVLSRITAGLVTSCKLQLEETPPVPNDVYVVVGDDSGGTALKQNDADGWVYDNSVKPPAIVIQGAACTKLETDGAPFINVSYGCPDFQPPK